MNPKPASMFAFSSIHWPERSARAAKFLGAVSHCVSPSGWAKPRSRPRRNSVRYPVNAGFNLALALTRSVVSKTLAKRSVDLAELRAIFVGVVSQFVQVINAHAKSKFEGFGFLLARDFKALTQITLGLIQILV